MTPKKRPAGTVRIGGKDIGYAQAAFMAVEADRRQCSPLQASGASIPDPLPEWVMLAGHRVSIATAAAIAEEAAHRNATPEWVIDNVLEAHAIRRAKGRGRP